MGFLDSISTNGFGKVIKFDGKAGTYVVRDSDESMDGREFVADIYQASGGFKKFNGKGEKPESRAGSIFPRDEAPERASLGDLVALGQFDAAVAALKQQLARNPNSAMSCALLASCYGYLGRFDEARAAWAEVLRIAPNFSIERQRRVLPYKNPDDFERRVEGMRKAGLPV
jgi:tetratricopeptide (TPR) repeat protein